MDKFFIQGCSIGVRREIISTISIQNHDTEKCGVDIGTVATTAMQLRTWSTRSPPYN